MFIDIIPNRASPPAVLLREAWREGAKIRKRTLANLSSLSPEQTEAMRRILRGETRVGADAQLEIERSWPHGHVAAALGTLRHLGLETMLASRPSPERTWVVAMIVARILAPGSQLATARGLDAETTGNTLGQELGLTDVDAEALYAALDWVEARQARIEGTPRSSIWPTARCSSTTSRRVISKGIRARSPSWDIIATAPGGSRRSWLACAARRRAAPSRSRCSPAIRVIRRRSRPR